MRCDVLVVGAGPSGLSCADELASSYRVFVAEEHPRVGEPEQCTGMLGLSSLETLGVDYKASALSYVDKARLHSGNQCLEFSFSRPVAVVVDRARFDRELARKAEARGAEILTSTKVLGIERKDKEWEVNAVRNGRAEKIVARALVGADGFRSKVALSLGLRDRWGSGRLLSCYQVVVRGEVGATEVYFTPLAKNFFAWKVPAGSCSKVGLCLRGSAMPTKRALEKFIEEKEIGGEVFGEDGDVIPLGTVAKTYAQGALIVGEAAGFIKPLTGGGVIYGITSGRLAGKVLKEAADFSEGSLASYEGLWKESFGREIDFGLRFSRLFYSLSLEEMERIFSAVDREAMDEVKKNFSFDNHSFLLKVALKQGYRVLRALGPKRSAELLGELRKI